LRNIIFDTDIGIDCDDACALSLLLELEKRSSCVIDAITVSTVRRGASAAVRAINDYYQRSSIPVGRRFGEALECDLTNVYAEAMMKKYGTVDSSIPAVDLLRKVLGEAKMKTTIIAVGPLSNLAELLKSKPDEYSSLDGASLIEQKVEEIFVMGGNFFNNRENDDGEFNIKQDIESARYFFDNCPRDILLVPFECGDRIYTNIPKNDTPMRFAMETFAKYHGADVDTFKRSSWDPLTCICALEDYTDYYYFSTKHKIIIDEKYYLCGKLVDELVILINKV
jgi:inosine-uridine nucleoside N-ribohydrolase